MVKKFETIDPVAYQVLEDIVGKDNVTREPANLDGYCFSFGIESWAGAKFSVRPLAAILPRTVEEIQAIVKACNRFKIQFKAHSTGFGPGLGGLVPHVSIDLRFMNRIVEIDAKNKYAVFEPYVSFGALMNACIRMGVRPYVIGAGPSASPLANVTNLHGNGTVNISAGWGGRVPLAMEWVLPDGDLVRTGTLGAVGEWYNGDGPGPSLRGIVKGMSGPLGALGVMTKLAIKLVPWYGPPEIESYGDPPDYEAKMPECFRSYFAVFPTREKLYDALRLIQEEQIAYWCSRRGPFTQVAAKLGSNREVFEQYQSGQFKKQLNKINHNLSIGLDGSSAAELEFKDKVLRKLVELTDGEVIEDDPKGMSAKFLHAFNGLGAVKGTFRGTGGLASSPNAQETADLVRFTHEMGLEQKNKYADKGIYLDDDDSTWVTLLEDFGVHMETPLRYDPAEPAGIKGMQEHMSEVAEMVVDKNLSWPDFDCGFGEALHDVVGPKGMNYHLWIMKIKKMLDPNLVGESLFYPVPDE